VTSPHGHLTCAATFVASSTFWTFRDKQAGHLLLLFRLAFRCSSRVFSICHPARSMDAGASRAPGGSRINPDRAY
jgi:hypothetical protein